MPKAKRRSSRRSTRDQKVINSYSQTAQSRFCLWHSPSARNVRIPDSSFSLRGNLRSLSITMLAGFEQHLSKTLDEIRAQGLYKTERIITGPQNAKISIADGRCVINLCANNYLGLADHPAILAAAKGALDTHGFGMASVRFICGTQDIHKELEAALTKFLGTEDTILYPFLFRRKRRLVRNVARRGRRRDQRRTKSRQHHRRYPAL